MTVERIRSLLARLLRADGAAKIAESWDSGDAALLAVDVGGRRFRVEIREIT